MSYPELNLKSPTLTLEGEIWKDIEGYENIYQVSNLGRVKRLTRVQIVSNQAASFPVVYPEIVMKANPDTRGYPQVTLSYPKRRVARVHRLVAEAFLKPPSQELLDECLKGGVSYALLNHIDENTMNAAVTNLEWCTPMYNNIYGKSRKGNPKTSGSANVHSKLTEEDVLEIIKILTNKEMSQERVALKFGIKQITVSNIWTGRSWSHLTNIPWLKRSRKVLKEPSTALSEQTCH